MVSRMVLAIPLQSNSIEKRNDVMIQWLFLVPLKGGRWYIIPQLAVYNTYILPSGGLYATDPTF